MKKKIIFLILLITMLLCSCEKHTSTPESLVDNTTNVKQQETLGDKLIYDIENEYTIESQKPEYTTTVGMIDLKYKYAEKWENISSEYYHKIENHIKKNSGETRADLLESLEEFKEKYEQYIKSNIDMYSEIYNLKYKGGSIIGVLGASKHYELQKEYALELIEIYECLNSDI